MATHEIDIAPVAPRPAGTRTRPAQVVWNCLGTPLNKEHHIMAQCALVQKDMLRLAVERRRTSPSRRQERVSGGAQINAGRHERNTCLCGLRGLWTPLDHQQWHVAIITPAHAVPRQASDPHTVRVRNSDQSLEVVLNLTQLSSLHSCQCGAPIWSATAGSGWSTWSLRCSSNVARIARND